MKSNQIHIEQVFENARSHCHWLPKQVSDNDILKIYNTMKHGPTSANSCPSRFIFLKSEEAKEKLKPCLHFGNIEKTLSAPVVAVIAYDLEFYEKLSYLFPHTNAKMWFEGNEQLIYETAFRNSSLQGAYLIMAARAHGFDCGPISGFDNAKLDNVFFPGSKWKSNFICNIGYGDHTRLETKHPRLPFEEACQIQ